ncbi:ABC transporter ATP-binding protein [Bacillus sp. RG28]|uniref:ABC transporter ATP-binding protein n=1 Tax=Gottfriedia endophytica TaxID=2820819 RepID=A0A940NGH0_9BACI|nr:ABC transporter ATP-binding protein [Gottfriedia endophytica]MBP0724974.1 ABC transporter ATP-binding protein [Gottfriedia endophytica]
MSQASEKNASRENFQPIRVGHGPRGRGPVVKPKDAKKTLIRLWSYFQQQKKQLVLLFLLILVDTLLVLAVPYCIGLAIDAMSLTKGGVNFSKLSLVVIGLGIIYFSDTILTFLQSWFTAEISQKIVFNLRAALFKKLHKIPVSFYDQHTHGEMMSRLSNDVDNISNTISQSTTQFMTGILTIVGSFCMMIWLSPILTVASLITIPLVFTLTKTISKKTKILFKEQQVQLGHINGQIEETISGIEIVKAFNHERKAIEEFEAINTKLRDVGLKAQIWSGFLMPIMNVINNIGFAVVATVGGVLAVKGMITVGVIASFLSYSRQFARPLTDLANIFNLLQSGLAGAERVFEILDEVEEIEDKPNAKVIENLKGEVEFKDVTFGYRQDVNILKGLSFSAKAGSNIAIVGPTGAGKTTIINLLTRFYEITGGSILIDGININEYTRDSLRESFGIVLQDTYLFSGTIKENIQYGKQDATDEEIERAAKLANAAYFIKRLPNGFDTVLSENGGELSQGQKQLLAIARVILANPSILILDEATSSVDTRTELHIQEAMKTIMKGRTSFMIAHRLSTIRDADTILVIDKGRITEMGSHEQLMENKDMYYQMVMNQTKNIEAM